MGFEVRLYEDGKLDPISVRNFRELWEAVKDVNGELGRSLIYAGTVSGEGIFIVRYWNGREVLEVPGPWALTAAEARQLKMINGHLRGLPRVFQNARGAIVLAALLVIAAGAGVVILGAPMLPGPDGTLCGVFQTNRLVEPFGEITLAIEDYPITGKIRRFRVCLTPTDPGADGWPRWTIKEWIEVPRLLVRSWREVYKTIRPPAVAEGEIFEPKGIR
jgi:hypothetical protein